MRRPDAAPARPGPGVRVGLPAPAPAGARPTSSSRSSSAAQDRLAPRAALRVLETSHPPTYYLPRAVVRGGRPAARRRLVASASGRAWLATSTSSAARPSPPRAAWDYPDADRRLPPRSAATWRSTPAPMDRCTVDGEEVVAAAGRLLRRLGDLAGGRAVQGRARHRRLVAGRPDQVLASAAGARGAPAAPDREQPPHQADQRRRAGRPPRAQPGLAPRARPDPRRPAPGWRRARRCSTAGTRPASTSRSIPPPMAETIPSSVAGTGPSP